METKSRRFTATPGRLSGVLSPERRSFQRFSPMSQSANACSTDVLPELLGPMKTTGLPSSTSTSPKRLKLRMVIFVSIGDRPHATKANWSLIAGKDTLCGVAPSSRAQHPKTHRPCDCT